jgi:hypothetical protein
MVSRLKTFDYRCEIGEINGNLAPVTYMLGYPDLALSRASQSA